MLRKLSVLAIVVLIMAACAKSPPPPPKPTDVTIDIQASADINPNAEGRASPLALRIYELKSLADFNKIDFVSLYGNDKGVLATNLVQKYEVILQPDDKKSMNFVAADDTKAIAVFAVYRQYEQAQWKASVPVEAHQINQVVINTGADKLEMKVSVKKATGK